MRACLLIFLFFWSTAFTCLADRIFIVNSSGYNTAEPQLIAAIALNGHTINTGATIPAGLTSSCNDPINGYDWLCFFGDANYISLLPQVQAFVSAGGKVFCQYEVTCCANSYNTAAAFASGVTGLNITPNINPYVAINGGQAGWAATNTTNIDSCVTFLGAAYKGMDSIPLANQLQATQTLPGASPPISTCLNFGFAFHPGNFSGLTRGAIVGIGDYNIWHDGKEPFSNGGTTPVNQSIVDYFFPSNSHCCFLLAPGCLDSTNSHHPNLGPDATICAGDSIILDPNSNSLAYLWQDGSTNATFTALNAGTYWVEVTTSCGLLRDSIQISLQGFTAFDLGQDTTLCNGDSLLLDASSGANNSYLWQDNSTNPTFSVYSSGIYSVLVTNLCGSGMDSIEVNFNPLPAVNLGVDTVLCTGNTLLLDASSLGITTYLWQDNSNDSTFLVTNNGTYSISVTNACGIASDNITVNFDSLPFVDFGGDTTICTGDTLVLNALNSLTTNYQWQDNSNNPTFLVTTNGLYTVLVSNPCGSDIDSIDINFNPLPAVNLGVDTILCAGNTLLLDASSLGITTYLWQDNSNDSTFLVTNNGIYSISVTNACGIASDNITVSFDSLPFVDLGVDSTLCLGNTLALDATNGMNSNYQWQDNSTNSTFLVSNSGNYAVLVSNQCGSVSDSITISYITAPVLDLGNDTSICPNTTLLLDAHTAGANSYQWQDNSSNATFLVSNGGTYSVSVSHECGWIIDTIVISTQSPPTVSLAADTMLCNGTSLLLNLNIPNVSYLWSDNSTSNSFEIQQSGNYWVQVSDDCASTASDSISIAYVDCDCILELPNAFSPNNDQINDAFGPVRNCPLLDYRLAIFNRWGQKVYESSDLFSKWDGKQQGVEAPTEVYIYTLQYTDVFGKTTHTKGEVTLLR